jgi:hypothetical protein
MHASIMNIVSLAALVSQATANIITFNNLSGDTLTLCFVANAGQYTPGQSSLYVFFFVDLPPPHQVKLRRAGEFITTRDISSIFLLAEAFTNVWRWIRAIAGC